jgi:hypothetical protein
MTTPAPQDFPDAPTGPSPAQLLQDARSGLERRASRLMTALGIFAALSVLGVLGLVLLADLGWQALQQLLSLPDFQADLGLPAGQTLADLFPGWALPTMLALSLVATAIQIWATLRARAAIGAVRDQTLNPSADHAQALMSVARTVRPWITWGQWAPILWTVFTVALSLITLTFVKRMNPETPLDPQLDSFSTAFALLSVVIQSLPGIVLTWLILAAIRRWLDAVLARAQGGMAPVTPASRSVESWLLFVLVVCVVGTVSLVISTLPLLLVPVLFAGMAADADFSDLSSVGLTPARVQLLLAGMAGLFVFSGVLYGLLTAVMAWSRGLAANVATLLDAPLPPPPPPQKK